MKKTTEILKLSQNLNLHIERQKNSEALVVTLVLNSKEKCLLHWGVVRDQKKAWELPPEANRPSESYAVNRNAVQTTFVSQKSASQIQIKFKSDHGFSGLSFVLYFPEKNYWDNNNGKNYFIRLPQSGESLVSPDQLLSKELEERQIVFRQNYHLSGMELAVAVILDNDRYLIKLFAGTTKRLVLHWGVAKKSRGEWLVPPEHLRPQGTTIVDKEAAQSPFLKEDDINKLQLEWKENEAVLGLCFVLYQPDTGKWLKSGQHIFIPIKKPLHERDVFEAAELADAADEIIQVETGRNSWTLMHRFNLCHDLLDRLGWDLQGLALLFVWLRFSAIRQLDWQRNYNTKPRELSHAQKRLTLRLAEFYRDSDLPNREIIRLSLSTVGRGGEGGKGQRIRDDILHIMHRHKIKEVTGHFMEEWHQKLHNNATPDDIVICEAYLAFLHSNGNLGAFYDTLDEGGVTKERLENFERPIVTQPDFAPHIKDGLIHDFENYLKLLKSIHSATDLFSAAEAANHCLDDHLRDWLWHFYHNRNNMNIEDKDQVSSITGLRRGLIERLNNTPDPQCIRDLLYLDLALEEFLRVVVERRIHLESRKEHLVELISLVLENLIFSYKDEDLVSCSHHWQELQKSREFDRDWVLHASSVLDRITRALGNFIDYHYTLLQPKAEHLGQAFHAEDWTIELFNQEVVRGSSAFVLSILLRHIEPILRKAADLGSWQIISRKEVSGEVEIADLFTVQDKVFKKPTVILTDTIKGEEEIPDGVVAVLTPAGVDILSHVSVRSRNAKILFASCYDSKVVDELKSYKGQNIKLTVNASGDVEYQLDKGGDTKEKPTNETKTAAVSCRPVTFSRYAVASKDFTSELVGGKSLQLMELKDKIPDWIRIPRSVAIPFCVCEKVLAMTENKALLEHYNKLEQVIDQDPKQNLHKLRQCINELISPDDLPESLKQAMANEGIPWPDDWLTLWERIKHVWASKWNERAYWSRKKWHIAHDTLHMAVLIQEVVDAQYAFVVHTANPFTNDKNELYGEVVFGLGETICSGNYPGRALSFTCSKSKKILNPKIISYPGKNTALKGSGLIVRSDSNGEDLEEYAGAGLYDSVLLTPPLEKMPDYIDSSLLWQEDFRRKFMQDITRLGIETENAMEGFPQDIEGAYADGKFYIVQTRPQV